MRHFTIELYGKDRDGEFLAFVSAPKFGASHEPQGVYDRRLVLSDGHNRVIVGIYNGVRMEVETVKRIARNVVEHYS